MTSSLVVTEYFYTDGMEADEKRPDEARSSPIPAPQESRQLVVPGKSDGQELPRIKDDFAQDEKLHGQEPRPDPDPEVYRAHIAEHSELPPLPRSRSVSPAKPEHHRHGKVLYHTIKQRDCQSPEAISRHPSSHASFTACCNIDTKDC